CGCTDGGAGQLSGCVGSGTSASGAAGFRIPVPRAFHRGVSAGVPWSDQAGTGAGSTNLTLSLYLRVIKISDLVHATLCVSLFYCCLAGVYCQLSATALYQSREQCLLHFSGITGVDTDPAGEGTAATCERSGRAL